MCRQSARRITGIQTCALAHDKLIASTVTHKYVSKKGIDGEVVGHLQRACNAELVVRDFFDAFNRRCLEDMAAAVADDCEHSNLAYPSPYRGKSTVVAFYRDFISAIPADAVFEIEDTTGVGSDGKIGVIWYVCFQYVS
jgi:hypothetical protein